MTFLSDVADAISAIAPDENVIFASNAEPPEPHECVTLYELGGPMGVLSLTADLQEDRSVQVRVRDMLQERCQTRCSALYDAFRAWVTDFPSALRMRAATQPVYSYPRDANGRSIASFTLLVLRGEKG